MVCGNIKKSRWVARDKFWWIRFQNYAILDDLLTFFFPWLLAVMITSFSRFSFRKSTNFLFSFLTDIESSFKFDQLNCSFANYPIKFSTFSWHFLWNLSSVKSFPLASKTSNLSQIFHLSRPFPPRCSMAQWRRACSASFDRPSSHVFLFTLSRTAKVMTADSLTQSSLSFGNSISLMNHKQIFLR